jgi:hypothetical protein
VADTNTRLAHLRQLSKFLDTAIRVPGTNIRFGLDGVLGLIPGVGDVTTGLASVFVILTAARMGVPAPVLARMIGNVAIDTAVGVIPILGDIFDVAWKANTRNVALTEQYMTAPQEERRRTERVSKWQLVGLIAVLIAVLVLGIIGAVALVRWILQAAQAMA